MDRRSLFLAFLTLASTALDAQESLGTASTPRERPAWARGFGIPGVGLSGRTLAWAVYDDGRGPAVYAGGWFRAADDVVANGIARWNGQAWEAVGQGIGLTFQQEIRALAVYDDGSGPALYAAGQFDEIDGKPAAGFARWDGSEWTVLPGQVGFGFHALLVGDDGSGPSLFAGGEFIRVGGIVTSNVARWDGNWRPLGGGLALRPVRALAFYDDGTGQQLFAGVDPMSGESPLRRWDGGAWSQVAGAPAALIDDLQPFDDGSGPRLAVASAFQTPSAVLAWDGSSFTPLDTLSQQVEDLDVLPGPGGTDLLVAAGSIFSASGSNPGNVAAWNGSSWLGFGTPPGATTPVTSMAVLDTGTGPELYLGDVAQVGSTPVYGTARWDGAAWSRVGGEQIGLDGSVNRFVLHDDGTGEALYAGGSFVRSGLDTVRGVARWNGSSWDPVGAGFYFGSSVSRPSILDFASYESGDGPVLVACGQFQRVGSLPMNNIARWNGVSWTALGPGILGGTVQAVEVFDDGAGPLLYAGGSFFATTGQPGSKMSAWDGVSGTWSALPGELSTAGQTSTVYAMCVFDDGGGPALLVGGDFDFAGETLVENLVGYDGSSWYEIPFGGLSQSSALVNAYVRSLLAVDLPTVGGPAVVVLGSFDLAGSLPVDGLALLTPSGWSAPANFSRGTIQTVSVIDAGGGPQLWGVDRLQGIVRWNGTDWIALGTGRLVLDPNGSTQSSASALFGSTDAGSPALWVGGNFRSIGQLVSTNIARWSLGGARLVPLSAR